MPSLVFGCLLIGHVGSGALYAAPPVVSHLFPAGGQRGARVEVTCTGEFSWPLQVWAPGVEVVATSESGKLEVTIPPDLPADRVWIRLSNAAGASAALPFLIGSLQETVEQEPNNSPRQAQALTDPNITINGALAGGDVDGFAVSLTAGQTLVADVAANAMLGSPMDAVLQVASPGGTVLAENHDSVQLDPRLAFTAPRDGTYVVRLFAFPAAPDTSIAFSGGANYVYRLTLTTGPFISHVVPLSVLLSDPGSVAVFGWNIPPGTRIPVIPLGGARMADDQEREPQDELRNAPDARLGLAFAPEFAGAARVRLTPHAVMPEIAPANADSLLTLTPPTAVTGWLRRPGQSDEYRVPLRQGQQVLISAESRHLGLLLDPVMQLLDPTGAVVADVDDSGSTRDAAITHMAAQEGEFRLTVRDRYRQGGERCLYRLTVRLGEPDFELSVGSDAVVVAPDKPAELTIAVQRHTAPEGTVGPITIEVVGLPQGVTVPAVVSEPEGATATEVKLSFSGSGAAFSGPVRVIGKASEPSAIERTARTPARLGAALETIWLTVAGAAEPKP